MYRLINTQSARSAIPGPASDKALKRRSLLPQLSRYGTQDELNDTAGAPSELAETVLQEEDRYDGSNDTAEGLLATSTQGRMRRPLSVRLPASSTNGIHTLARPSTRESDHSLVHGSVSGNAMSVRPTSEVGQTRRLALNRVPETVQASTLQRASSTCKTHARSGSTISTKPTTRPTIVSPISPTKNFARTGVKLEPLSKAGLNRQQQYASPAKSVVPKSAIPTGTIFTNPVAEGVSLEVARQQIELLQLSLMHERICAEIFDVEQDAQATLRDEHQRLRRSLGQIIGQELDRERQTNLVALSLWQSDQSYLMDRLRALQKLRYEILALTQEDSDFTTTVSNFRTWAAHAEKVVRGQQPGFVSGLSEDWRHAHASAALRIRSLLRELAALPVASRPSSVYTLMTACETLLDGMLREMDLMSQIERQLLRQDKDRIDAVVAALPNMSEDTPTQWVPRWQRIP